MARKQITMRDMHDRTFEICVDETPSALATIIIAPGAFCEAFRYDWLASALVKEKYSSIIINPPVVERVTPMAPDELRPTRFVSIDQIARAINWCLSNDAPNGPLFAVGHSLGGAIILEGLDGAEARKNPHAEYLEGQLEAFHSLTAAAILGAQLQPEAMGFKIPFRSADKKLGKPENCELLFVAAGNDLMAPPELMRHTASRYENGVRFEVIEGGNHLAWAEGTGEYDRPDLDGEAMIDAKTQQQQTADIIINFFNQTGS